MTYTNWNYIQEYEKEDKEKGIVAKTFIPKDSLIGIYDGNIKSYEIKNGRLADPTVHKDIVQIACTNETLFGLVTADFSGVDLINHSCNPNVITKDRIVLIAVRDIKKGEHLTIDYTTWDFIPEGIHCWCNPSNCII